MKTTACACTPATPLDLETEISRLSRRMTAHWYGRAIDAGRPVSRSDFEVPGVAKARSFMGAVRTAMKSLG